MSKSKRPSPSMAVALFALFVALGGTATAAKVLIDSSSQIKAQTIQRSDIDRDAINSGRVADSTLRLDDLNGAARRTIDSSQTRAYEVVRLAGPEDVGENESVAVATIKDLPAGSYAIFAKTILTAPSNDGGLLDEGDSLSGHCVLDAQGDTDEARALIGATGANAPGVLNMQITRTFEEKGSAQLRCDVSNQDWRASNTSIIALQLPIESRQNVTG